MEPDDRISPLGDGITAIDTVMASEREQMSMKDAVKRECTRYDLPYDRVLEANEGVEVDEHRSKRRWWDYFIVAAALSVFIWLGKDAALPTLSVNYRWVAVLVVVLLGATVISTWALWKKTRFS